MLITHKKSNKMKHIIYTINRGFRTLILPVALLLGAPPSQAQNCTVNAGVNQNVCTSTATLTGNQNGSSVAGTLLWSFVTGPATPTIVSPTSLSTQVNGMSAYGTYTFKLRSVCQSGDTVSQTVDIVANALPSFTAGSDFAYCGKTQVHTMTATLPSGWTGIWTAVDATNPGSVQSSRFNFSNPNSPTTTVQLVTPRCPSDMKYGFQWEITSPNGLCKYTRTITGIWNPDTSMIDWTIAPATVCQGNAPLYVSKAGKCSFYGGYNTDYLFTTSIVSAPAGYSGTLTLGTGVGGELYVTSGLTMPGRYVFNATLNTPCGNKPFGPFDVTVLPPRPTVTNNKGDIDGYCIKTAPASVSFLFNLDTTIANLSLGSYSRVPTGADPMNLSLIKITGQAGYTHSLTITPNTKWSPGVYEMDVKGVNKVDTAEVCAQYQRVYVLIYDTVGTNMHMTPVNSCIPMGNTTTDITFPLPPYPNYLSGTLSPSYQLVKISGPAAGPGSFNTGAFATTGGINGLTAGTYVYRIQPTPGNRLADEMACSNSPSFDTLRIRIYNAVGANAGTDQTVSCIQNYPLSGNAIASPSFGTWSQVSGPTTLSFTNLHDPNAKAYNPGTAQAGTYILRWATSDSAGSCPIYADSVTINSSTSCPFTTPLALQVTSFKGQKANGRALLSWTTANEEQLQAFVLEWSTTGGLHNDWTSIANVAASGNKTNNAAYSFLHTPSAGDNYYRLRQVGTDGSGSYAPAVKLTFDADNRLQLFPNPVTDLLYINNAAPGARLSLYSSDGMLLWQRTAGATSEQLDMRDYRTGYYLLTILHGDGSVLYQYRIMKQ